MSGSDRYDTSTSAEGQYEPGSEGRVLRNKLGISDPEQMELLEFDRLLLVQDEIFAEVSADQPLTAQDLREWHRRWLGPVYEWAGRLRTVNLSKQGFPFAASNQLERLMFDYQQLYLDRWTPACELDPGMLTTGLAECHVELILIHPFREGNGRLARLLANVMALQADQPPLDFSVMELEPGRYISAIHAGHSGNLQPMIEIFSAVLDQSR